MRRTLMAAWMLSALAVPSFAEGRDSCSQQAHDRKVTGTVLGAVGGALVGGAVADTKGAVIGGVGGAVIGNNPARVKCDRPLADRTRAAPRAARRAYRDASYAAGSRCTYENRRYYDERGQTISTPVQVCR